MIKENCKPAHAAQEKGSCKNCRGFFYTFEAATAIILLVIAATTLQLYEAKKQDAGGFFLCSDAAALLAKSGVAPHTVLLPSSSASDGITLQEKVDELHSLSGMCISAELPGGSASSCTEAGAEKISFSMPVWNGRAGTMTVQCWREK